MDNGSNRLDDHGDLRKIGNSSPRYHYGINFSANWNGIDFAVFFQGVGKRDWYPAGESGLFWGQYDRPYGYSLPWQNADRWSEDNPNAYWPRLRGSLAVSGRGTLRAANDRYLQKAPCPSRSPARPTSRNCASTSRAKTCSSGRR